MKSLCIHLSRLWLDANKAGDRCIPQFDELKQNCIQEKCGHWDSAKGCCSLNVIVTS